MYEQHFRLSRRPFAATPNPSCFLPIAVFQGAFDELFLCAQHGHGIGILTAPAGCGKTLLCERLQRELNAIHRSIFLRHSQFRTRRDLIQSVLAGLGYPFPHNSEQESRLQLEQALRTIAKSGQKIVLICDEAHALIEPVLDELRIMSDIAEDGSPVIRLVLSGQIDLEEKLAMSGLSPLAHRIRAHVNLTPLSNKEAIDYLDYRMTWAGGRTEEVLLAETVEFITRASDGNPRSMNQLADQILLVAYAQDEIPAGLDSAIQALEQLQQLPLEWNQLAVRNLRPNGENPLGSADESIETTNFALDQPVSFPEESIEFGGHTIEFGGENEAVPRVPFTELDGEPTYRLIIDDEEHSSSDAAMSDGVTPGCAQRLVADPVHCEQHDFEALVIDRYTAIDAGWEIPPLPAAPLKEKSPLETSDGELQANSPIASRSESPVDQEEEDDDVEQKIRSEVEELGRMIRRDPAVKSADLIGEKEESISWHEDDSSELFCIEFSANDDRCASDLPAAAADRPSDSIHRIDQQQAPLESKVKNLFTLLRRKQSGRTHDRA